MKKTCRFRSFVCAVIIFILFVLAYLFQGVFLPFAGLKMPVYILLSAAVAVSMFEHWQFSLVCGIFAGVLTDMTSSAPDGIYAFLFAVIVLCTNYLAGKIFRNTLSVSLILTAGAALITAAAGFVMNFLTGDSSSAVLIVKGFYVPAVLATLIVTPVTYYTIGKVESIKK